MTFQVLSSRRGGPTAHSEVRLRGTTLAPLESGSGQQRGCAYLSKEVVKRNEMGATTSSTQDLDIDLSCLPEEFVEGLRSVAEVKQHQKNGRYEVGERGELPDPSPSKVTLFIDVDETIVYVTPIPLLKVEADRIFEFSEPGEDNGGSKSYTATPLPPISLEEAAAAAERFDPNSPQAILYVYHRPFVKRLLTELRDSGKFEIVAFTAALPEYANPILDTLEVEDKLFDHRLYRQHCCRAPRTRSGHVKAHSAENHWPFTGEAYYYIKDLEHAAQNRELKRCVLLDNSPVSFAAQMENGIYLRPFCGDPGDDELQFLSNMLFQLHTLEDVRVGLQTGLINAAWRSLVARDSLYELAGVPSPTPEVMVTGDDIGSSGASHAEASSVEKVGEALAGFPGINYNAAEMLEVPWVGDNRQRFGTDMQTPLPSTKRQAGLGHHQRKASSLKPGFPVLVGNGFASTPSLAARQGGSRVSTRCNRGNRNESQVSVHPREARRSGHLTPLSTIRSQRTLQNGGSTSSMRERGPRTPRSTDHRRDEKDVYEYSACYEAGRARDEAAEAGSVAEACRNARYQGGTRRYMASIEGAHVRKEERGHTGSCLKQQEREGTTWCSCTGTKSQAAPASARCTSQRRSGSVLTIDSADGSRHARERHANTRTSRGHIREMSDGSSIVSVSQYYASATVGAKGRVPRLHLQGVVHHGRGTSIDESMDDAFEDPATPGRQPLTPNARRLRLVNIDQILEDSVALSRQVPEPMVQCRNRLKQPPTLYGCPDVQAPNLLCGRQEDAPRPPSGSRRPLTGVRKGQTDADGKGDGNTAHVAPQPPASWNFGALTMPHQPSHTPCYVMRTTHQQPNCGALKQQMPYVQPIGTPTGWPLTPRFTEPNVRFGPKPNNVGPIHRPPSMVMGSAGSYRGAIDIPQSSYRTTPRCLTPAKDYNILRQHITMQPQNWNRVSVASGFGAWTPRESGGQFPQTPSTPRQIQGPFAHLWEQTHGGDVTQREQPKLFAGRRMRLGDLFGTCNQRASSSRPEVSRQAFQMGQQAPSPAYTNVRPAVLVRRDQMLPSSRASAEQQHRMARSPTATFPSIIPFVTPMQQTPRGHLSMQSAGPIPFSYPPHQGGAFGQGFVSPMQRGIGGSTTSLPRFYGAP